MTVVSMRQAALRAGDFGERQDQIDDLDARRTLAPDSISAKTGEPYAEIIRRHGIVKFEFSYATGAFHALDLLDPEARKISTGIRLTGRIKEYKDSQGNTRQGSQFSKSVKKSRFHRKKIRLTH